MSERLAKDFQGLAQSPVVKRKQPFVVQDHLMLDFYVREKLLPGPFGTGRADRKTLHCATFVGGGFASGQWWHGGVQEGPERRGSPTSIYP
jgi:hypothetical protein